MNRTMKTLAFALIFAVSGPALLAPPSHAGDPKQTAWLTSWEEAVARSKKEKKPILVDFTGSDWCGWCIKLKKEIFETKDFKDWARDKVILLELDFPRRKAQKAELKQQNAGLRKKYKVRSYPTILFLDAEGKVLGKSGYRPDGPKAWVAHAETRIRKD